MYETAAHDLIVMDYQEKEVLIPLTEPFVQGVDLETKKVFTHLPEGLLAIYLEEKNNENLIFKTSTFNMAAENHNSSR